MSAQAQREQKLEREVERLREGLDTVDWLLHTDRQEHKTIARGEQIKGAVVELVRALLGDEWLKARKVKL